MNRRHLYRILLLLFLVWTACVPLSASANENGNDALRIGCITNLPNQQSSIAYREYYASFIDELAKYSDQVYEIIHLSPDEAIPALETGRINVLFPAEKQHGQPRILYTEGTFGSDIVSLFTRTDESRFTVTDIGCLNDTTVGLLVGRSANDALDTFTAENGLTLTTRYFTDKKELLDALASGEIDLVLDTMASINEEEKHFLSIGICPIYAASLGTGKDALDSIDRAAIRLRKEYPSFNTMRQMRFWEKENRNFAYFRHDEAIAIQNMPPLKIAFYRTNAAPFFDYDEDGVPYGIYPDLLKAIEKNSGLRFEYVTAWSYENAKNMMRSGEADVILDIYSNGPATVDFYYTAPLLLQKFVFVSDKYRQDAMEKPYRVALPLLSQPMKQFVEKIFPQAQVMSRPTEITALDAVAKGEADGALLNNLRLQNSRPLIIYPNLNVVPDSSINVPVSLAISSRHSRQLQSLLNRAILRLSPQLIDQTILRNTLANRPTLTLSHAIYYYPVQCGLVLGLAILAVACIGFFYHHSKNAMQQRNAIRERNMHLEDALESIIEANKARDSYKQLAETCPLTGLLNRAAIQQAGEHLFCEKCSEGRVHALMITDLDHFKEANDICGHAFGDKVLKDYATMLRQILREEDLAGRFGGDEFIVLLRNIHPEDAAGIARRINEAARTIEHREGQPQITASIGIALCPDHGITYESLFRAADHALYEVKEHGRDGYAMVHGKYT